MDQEQIKRIIDSPPEYDVSREDTWMSMARDFYSRKMRSIAILVFVWAIVFSAAAAYTGMKFLRTDQTKDQIMYATLFIPCVLGVGLMKVFAWQMLSANSIKREIKRLELRIAELNRLVSEKP